jgi:UDP-glucose 4-epimerase
VHIVLIGGSGFIGEHFAHAACAAGHEVTVVSRRPAPTKAEVRWIDGGIAALAADRATLASADIVCHFASTSVPAASNLDPAGDIRDNLLTGVQLLDAMRDAGTTRIMYLSSGGAIYGQPRYSPIDEEHPQDPMSSYGIVKASMEHYLSLYARLYGLRPLVVRPSNPFGPGQAGSGQFGVVANFLALAASGATATIFGDGSIVRDFVYIDDLTRFLLAAAQSDRSGVYNCGSGVGHSLIDVLHAVEQACGHPIGRRHVAARAADPSSVVLDIRRAAEHFSWAPRVSLEEGVAATWRAGRAAS